MDFSNQNVLKKLVSISFGLYLFSFGADAPENQGQIPNNFCSVQIPL